MSKWPMVPLKAVALPVSRDLDVKPGTAYRTIGVRWWGEGAYERKTIDGSETQAKKLTLVKQDDLIINKIWVRHGSTAVAGEDVDGCAASNEFPTFSLDPQQIHTRWMHWICKSQMFWSKCDALSMGTSGKNRIKPERFLTIEIPLPPLSEQKKIVEWIDAVDTRVEEAKGLQVESDQLAQHVVQSFITKTFEEHLESDEVWKLVPLTDVATVARGKFGFRPRNDPRFYRGKYPFIQIGDISDSNRYIRKFGQSLNEQGLEVSRMFPSGTVVIAITGATIGATGILTFNSCFPDSIVGINAISDEVPPEYLYWALEYAKSQALAQATQTTQPNINLRILNTLQIPMSSPDKLKGVVQTLDSLYESLSDCLNQQSERSDEIDALLPSILNQIFNGDGNG